MNNYSKKIIESNASKKFFEEENKVDYLLDATNLKFAKDNSIDFIVSSHLLEHISNPIKAILEWKRVLRNKGIIYLAVPNKKYTFDHKRNRTTLNHLIDDFKNNTPPEDTTYIEEFIQNYDEDMGVQNREELRSFIQENIQTNIHHHVWIGKDLKELFNYLGLEILLFTNKGNTIHIIGKVTK